MFHLIFILAVLFLFYELYWKRRNLPPGPTPLPLLGNILSLNKKDRYAPFLKWRREYGPVYTYWLAEMPVIAVSDFAMMQDTFVKNGDVFAGRMWFDEIGKLFRGGRYGLVDTEGEYWQEQRRFVLQVLRDFGMGKNLMQERVLDEVSAMLKSLSNENGDICDLTKHFQICIGSIINSMLFGYRFEGAKLEEFMKLKDNLTEHMHLVTQPAVLLLILKPEFLKHLPYFSGLYQKLVDHKKIMFNFFNKQIKEHEEEIDLNSLSEPSDFVEAYLRKMQEEPLTENGYTMLQLENICMDLWVAGLETTVNTCSFIVLFLLHHPSVQQQIHDELDEVIGSSRLITISDKQSLPYINAVISEGQRLANLLPQMLFHRTVEDIEVNGYKFPKNTCVLPQVSCVLFDEKIFPEPYEFRPERFLNENNQIKKIDELIPFSIGKRQCLGEGLAKMELFLLISNLYNAFEVKPENEQNLPTLEKRPGITMQTYPYKVKLVRRF